MSALLAPTSTAIPKGRRGLRGPKAETKPHPATMISYVYDQDEHDFLLAVERFKSRTGRKFPTLADYLQIAKSIGFTRTLAGNPGEGR